MHINLQMIVLFGMTAISCLLGSAIFRGKLRGTGAKTVGLMMFVASAWMLSFAMEIGSSSILAKHFWDTFQWAASILLPPLWLIFVLQFSGREHLFSKRNLVLMSTIPLMADSAQIYQLFQNLIGNAIKFRSDRPLEIQIKSEPEGDEWHFVFSDNGIGIQEKYFDKIFQVFQRLHNREEYPGIGIVLALCKRIVDRHGGHIWAESEAGVGSSFHFTLPEKGISQE